LNDGTGGGLEEQAAKGKESRWADAEKSSQIKPHEI
jgi:hypothetical protein